MAVWLLFLSKIEIVRILIVEDEPRLLSVLGDGLKHAGYAVLLAPDAAEADFTLKNYPCDLVVLDLGLPDRDGLELLKSWRKQGIEIPVLILTARSDWNRKVEGLEAGADDYVTKPFHVEELVARIHALLRRSRGRSQNTTEYDLGVRIDFGSRRVFVGASEISLTSFEFNLLAELASAAGDLRSKTSLSERLYDRDEDTDSNVLEVLVGRLRKKFAAVLSEPVIETVRGAGYRFSLRERV